MQGSEAKQHPGASVVVVQPGVSGPTNSLTVSVARRGAAGYKGAHPSLPPPGPASPGGGSRHRAPPVLCCDTEGRTQKTFTFGVFQLLALVEACSSLGRRWLPAHMQPAHANTCMPGHPPCCRWVHHPDPDLPHGGAVHTASQFKTTRRCGATAAAAVCRAASDRIPQDSTLWCATM